MNSIENDARGDLEYEINANEVRIGYTYDKNRRLTHTRHYDQNEVEVAVFRKTYNGNGNLEAENGPNGFQKRYEYNAMNDVTHEWVANDTPDESDDPLVQYEYGERGWLVKKTDSMGRETVYGYHPNKQIQSVTTPIGTTSYTYNDNAEQETVTDPMGWTVKTFNDITNLTTTVTDPYKAIGGDPAVFPADTSVVVKTFDKNGNNRFIRNRLGNEFESIFDSQDRTTDSYTPLRRHSQFFYNDNGSVSRVQEPSGQQVQYSYYPASGRLQRIVDEVGAIDYDYDPVGNITNVTTESDAIQYEYDHRNKVKFYTDANGNTIGYRYYANGKLWKLVYPDDDSDPLNNKVVMYAYYNNGQLKTVTDWNSRTTTYHYNDDGTLRQVDRPNNTSRHMVYTLDGQIERITEKYPDGRIIALYNYNYNSNGTLESRFALPKPHPCEQSAQTLTYDADNRIATHNGNTVIFDNDGNMTAGPLTNDTTVSYNYNARNQLVTVGDATYAYDAQGNRVSATEGAVTTHYVVDPNRTLPQVLVREKSGVKTYYVYGMGLQYEVNESDDATYYHFNQIGSTVALTDDSGTVTDRIEYSPYGIVTHRTGNTGTPFLFAGVTGVQADSNGLLYMRARYYNPHLRRFINSDPSGFAGGMNFYAYANGNPLMFIDPSGLCGEESNTIGVALIKTLDKTIRVGRTILGAPHYFPRNWLENRFWKNSGFPQGENFDMKKLDEKLTGNRNDVRGKEAAFHKQGDPINLKNNKITTLPMGPEWMRWFFRYGTHELIERDNGDGTHLHVDDPINMGTMNYGQDPITHTILDVILYVPFGSSPSDPSHVWERVGTLWNARPDWLF